MLPPSVRCLPVAGLHAVVELRGRDLVVVGVTPVRRGDFPVGVVSAGAVGAQLQVIGTPHPVIFGDAADGDRVDLDADVLAHVLSCVLDVLLDDFDDAGRTDVLQVIVVLVEELLQEGFS